jgi:predicted phage terminase large subunit-like protein
MNLQNITQKELYSAIRHITTDVENRDDCFYQFIKYFWGVIVKDKMIDNWHVRYLANELQSWAMSVIRREEKDHDMIINISPGESKSTICSILFPAWVWTIDPSIVFLTVSYNIDLSVALAVRHKDVINSSLYKSCYGSKVKIRDDMDAKFYFVNTAGGYRFSSSVGAKLTGFHGHIKIMDDPNNPFESFNPDLYAKTNTWYDQVYRSRNTEESITKELTVQQRCGINDMTNHLLSKEKKVIKHIRLPSTIDYPINPPELILNYKDGMMNPLRRNMKVLASLKDDVGDYIYDCQYGQNPEEIGGGIVQNEDIEIVKLEELDADFWSQPIYVIVDSAQKDAKKNDPTGILVCIYHMYDIYILDYINERMNFFTLKTRIQDVFFKYAGSIYTSMIIVEEASSGYAIVSELQNTTPLNIFPFPKPLDTKFGRFMSNQNIFRSKRVKCLDDSFAGHSWTRNFKKKLEKFPNVKHDEEVDCINMAIEHLIKSERENKNTSRRKFYSFD